MTMESENEKIPNCKDFGKNIKRKYLLGGRRMRIPSKEVLMHVYGNSDESTARFQELAKQFKIHYGNKDMEFFTSPGRTELIGNHTDHNGGKVIAASINMDTIAAVAQNDTNVISIISEGYEEEIRIDVTKLALIPKNQGTLSLVAGILEAAKHLGVDIKGFDVYVTTNVISSAGVSSSASFEMLLCSIINYFFSKNQLNCIDYAKMGQYAENKFWNKASGLLDQMACAVGGTILLDFAEGVKYEILDFSFEQTEYDFFIINTGKGHADLSNEYSKVSQEMKLVANKMGVPLLSKGRLSDLVENLSKIESNISNDRAFLRAFHFFEENERVDKAVNAIQRSNMAELILLMQESGDSSFQWLQNCYCSWNELEQKIPLTLALTKMFIKEIGSGCCRVHGGGFCGVIMSVIPKSESNNYLTFISRFMKREDIHCIQIRKTGAFHLQK